MQQKLAEAPHSSCEALREEIVTPFEYYGLEGTDLVVSAVWKVDFDDVDLLRLIIEPDKAREWRALDEWIGPFIKRGGGL